MLKSDVLKSLTHFYLLKLSLPLLSLSVSFKKQASAHPLSLPPGFRCISLLCFKVKDFEKVFCTHFSYFLPSKATAVWLLSWYPAEIVYDYITDDRWRWVGKVAQEWAVTSDRHGFLGPPLAGCVTLVKYLTSLSLRFLIDQIDCCDEKIRWCKKVSEVLAHSWWSVSVVVIMTITIIALTCGCQTSVRIRVTWELSFDFHLHGIPFSIPSLSVCMGPYVWSGSLVDSIYMGLVFVSIQPVYVFWLGHLIHSRLR